MIPRSHAAVASKLKKSLKPSTGIKVQPHEVKMDLEEKEDKTDYSQKELKPQIVRLLDILTEQLKEEYGEEEYKKLVPKVVTKKHVNLHPTNKSNGALELVKAVKFRERRRGKTTAEAGGFCFGLMAVLFSDVLTDMDPEEFYRINKLFVTCSNSNLAKNKHLFIHFFGRVEWAQWVKFYDEKNESKITQKDLDKVLEALTGIPMETIYFSKDKKEEFYSESGFAVLLNKMNKNTVMNIGSVPQSEEKPRRPRHAIGVYCDQHGNFGLYDANYESNKTKWFDRKQIHELFLEIRERLYTFFDFEMKGSTLPLKIQIVGKKADPKPPKRIVIADTAPVTKTEKKVIAVTLPVNRDPKLVKGKRRFDKTHEEKEVPECGQAKKHNPSLVVASNHRANKSRFFPRSLLEAQRLGAAATKAAFAKRNSIV